MTIGGGRRRRRRVLVTLEPRRRVGDSVGGGGGTGGRRRWMQQWRVGESGGGEGGTGGMMRCEAAMRGSGARQWCEAVVDAAAVRAVEGDNDGDGFDGGSETGSEEDDGRRGGGSKTSTPRWRLVAIIMLLDTYPSSSRPGKEKIDDYL
ncbi:hypothetical protein Syun_022897 [Stephania yunnanensis]|uniref:Uncharacterized protein n=1 Tax=Stephania yunnanensis TaxID=152371 RepID=A0AAP0F8S8_9MAGN